MEYNSIIKRSIIGLAILVAVAFIAALAVSYVKKNNSDQAQVNTTIGKKVDVPKSQLPKSLPVDLPKEENITVVDNYSVAMEDGKEEGARLYVTNNTAEENVAIYNEYLQSSGWAEISNRSYDNLKIISATRGSERILINISKTEDDKTSTVAVYVTK